MNTSETLRAAVVAFGRLAPTTRVQIMEDEFGMDEPEHASLVEQMAFIRTSRQRDQFLARFGPVASDVSRTDEADQSRPVGPDATV